MDEAESSKATEVDQGTERKEKYKGDEGDWRG
jgi:hypothetical protein